MSTIWCRQTSARVPEGQRLGNQIALPTDLFAYFSILQASVPELLNLIDNLLMYRWLAEVDDNLLAIIFHGNTELLGNR